MLQGHVELTQVLFDIGSGATVEDVPWNEKLDAFLRPFSYPLWACILCLLLLSGLCDYVLEQRKGGSLSSSMYEVSAGVLWGGFEEPRTRASALLQILVSFFVLITVATFTGSTAAFLTIKKLNPPTVVTLQSVFDTYQTVCIANALDWYASAALSARYDKLGQLLVQFITVDELVDGFADGECAVGIAPSYMLPSLRERGDPQYGCTLTPREAIMQESAGWAVAPEETCVRRAVEWALATLRTNGEIEKLTAEHIRLPETCTVAGNMRQRRRQLNAIERSGFDADQLAGSSGAALPPLHRPLKRALKGGSASSGAATVAAGTAGGMDSEVEAVSVDDYAGVILCWGVGCIVLVATDLITRSLRARSERFRNQYDAAKAVAHLSVTKLEEATIAMTSPHRVSGVGDAALAPAPAAVQQTDNPHVDAKPGEAPGPHAGLLDGAALAGIEYVMEPRLADDELMRVIRNACTEACKEACKEACQEAVRGAMADELIASNVELQGVWT